MDQTMDQTMEYLTTCVRWCGTPEAHINFVQPESKFLKWHIQRYTSCHLQHLTLICVKVLSADTAQVKDQSLQTMTCLWMDPNEEMVLGSLDLLLDISNRNTPGVNVYSVCHTPVSFMGSFYEHVQGINGLMKRSGWTPQLEQIVSDNDTSFRMLCEHEPHVLHVVRDEAPFRMLRVACNKPQTIYELLLKYGLACSSVWTQKIHLSARAPCCALTSLHLPVHVNAITHNSEFGEFPKRQVLHDNKKFIKVRTQYKVMRDKPYEIPLLQQEFWDDDYFMQYRQYSIPVAIYYHNPTSTLKDIISADGRFMDSIGCMKISNNPEEPNRIIQQNMSLDDEIGHTLVRDLDSNVDIILLGTQGHVD